MIERAPPPAASEPWRWIVASRPRDADHWDVALFVDAHLAAHYYSDIVLPDRNVAEACLAAVDVHHTRP